MAKASKTAAKKPAAPKPPSFPFTTVHLRGSAFTDHDKAAIAKFMKLKNEKQATSAVMRMVHGYFSQASQMETLIKDLNASRDREEKLTEDFRIIIRNVEDYQQQTESVSQCSIQLKNAAVAARKKLPK